MTATSLAAQRDAATTNGLITAPAPDLCVLSVPSDLHIIRWQLLLLPQLWGFWPFSCRDASDALTLLVCHHNLEASSLSVVHYNGTMDSCTTKHNTHALLHALVVAFPPRLTTITADMTYPPKGEVRSRVCYAAEWEEWLTGVTTVIQRDLEITGNHQGSVTGEGCPQASTPSPTVDGKWSLCLLKHASWLFTCQILTWQMLSAALLY